MLLMLFGPPAVGKLAVGRAITERSDFRLLHNHHTIELLLEIFDYHSPAFQRLNSLFRREVLAEAARTGTDLIFTFVWNLEDPSDAVAVGHLLQPFTVAGQAVAFAELSAPLAVRLERNRTELRLAEKKSKRDLAWSDANVRHHEQSLLNTPAPAGREGSSPSQPTPDATELLRRYPHLRIDNTDLSAEDAGQRILDWLTLAS